MGRLYVYRGRRRVAVYELSAATVVIGRALDAEVHLDDPLASRQHAEIWAHPDGSRVLEDQNSDNGTYVDGERVQTVSLEDGMRFAIGRHVLFYRDGGEPGAATAAVMRAIADDDLDGSGAQAPGMGERTTARLPQVKLEQIQQKAADLLECHLSFDHKLNREPFLLEADRYVLGYSAECDLRLPGRGLFVKRAVELLEDKNGVWLAVALHKWAAVKVRGQPSKMAPLHDGDVLSIGKVDLTFHSRIA
jgi:predicted component of type VI protein secretion system